MINRIQNIIQNIIDIIYDLKGSLYYNIANILMYIHFFKENTNTKKSSYEILFENYCNDIISEYNYQIRKLNNNDFDQLIEHFENVQFQDKTDYLKLIIDNFIQKKELKTHLKELKNFYTNYEIVDYMLDLIDKNSNKKKIINLFSGTGTFMRKAINKKINFQTLYGFDINNELNIIAKLLLRLETEDKNVKIFNGDLLKDEINIEKSDIIISDLPSDIKNLTHASCCSKIKQLKIRGTKSEPLIIQLITTLLTKNGKAILFIPDSFLFSDSNQHVETRKYLLNNFCIEQVIAISEHKKSILIFSNKKQDQQIKLTDINNTYEYLLDNDKIVEKFFSLFYQNYYIDLNEKPINKQTHKLRDIIKIDSQIQEQDQNLSVLISLKNNTFKIIKPNEIELYQYVYTTQRPDIYPQEFLNYHLFEFLVKNINYVTKGKCKSINIDLILDFNINIPDIKIQKNIMEFINLNSSVLIMLQQQITELEQMKINLIESTIIGKETTPVLTYCDVIDSNGIDTIQINRNSNIAGLVSFTSNEVNNSSNMFYLNIKNGINKDVIYYLLKYNEKELMRISNSRDTIQLPKGKLENLPIPILNEDDQNNLLKCKDIDNKLKKINEIYQALLLESGINIF